MIDAKVHLEKETAGVVPLFPKANPEVGASVEVRAHSKGVYGIVREPGEVFSVPVGLKGSWFTPVEKPAAAEAKGTVLSDVDLA